MGARSKIEWTDSTFNPWVGCTKVARTRGAPSACDFCYAEKWAKRSGQVEMGQPSTSPNDRSVLAEPIDLERSGAIISDQAWTLAARVLRISSGCV